MNHPIFLKTLADIHQAELPNEAEARRAEGAAGAGQVEIRGRWLAIAMTAPLSLATRLWLFA